MLDSEIYVFSNRDDQYITHCWDNQSLAESVSTKLGEIRIYLLLQTKHLYNVFHTFKSNRGKCTCCIQSKGRFQRNISKVIDFSNRGPFQTTPLEHIFFGRGCPKICCVLTHFRFLTCFYFKPQLGCIRMFNIVNDEEVGAWRDEMIHAVTSIDQIWH